jgi:hypothetical protein
MFIPAPITATPIWKESCEEHGCDVERILRADERALRIMKGEIVECESDSEPKRPVGIDPFGGRIRKLINVGSKRRKR